MLGVVPLFTLDTGLSRYDALELSIILIDGKPGSDQAIALIIRHLTQNKRRCCGVVSALTDPQRDSLGPVLGKNWISRGTVFSLMGTSS